MAKKLSKLKIVKKWNEKLSDSEKIYKKIRKENKELPGWEKSEIYKEILKRKKRALNRSKNADEINKRQRDLYKAKKEIEKLRDKLTEVSTVSVFEAYSGNGRIFENNIRQLVKDKRASFFGEIFIDDKKDSSFTNVERYSFRINQILHKIYTDKDNGKSLSALSWNVTRKYFYGAEKNALYVSHEFFSPDYEGNEEAEF